MASNPFAARYLKPGVVPFVFSGGGTAAEVVQRLAREQWWGQIVGPHGSGKSTLLAGLAPELERAGRLVVPVTLHQGERAMPRLPKRLSPQAQLVVDGYEQLSWWSRWTLQARCRAAGSGLLVTSHADAGLPLIFATATTLELACHVARQLAASAEQRVTEQDVAAAYTASGGNVRETLFALFDVYQRRGVK